MDDELGDISGLKPLAVALIRAQRGFAGAEEQVSSNPDSIADLDRIVAEIRAERRQRGIA